MPELNVVILILYLILVVILGMEWRQCQRGEIIAWLSLAFNGLAFIVYRLLDPGPIDVVLYNTWSHGIRIQTVATLILIEAARYRRLRGTKHGC